MFQMLSNLFWEEVDFARECRAGRSSHLSSPFYLQYGDDDGDDDDGYGCGGDGGGDVDGGDGSGGDDNVFGGSNGGDGDIGGSGDDD